MQRVLALSMLAMIAGAQIPAGAADDAASDRSRAGDGHAAQRARLHRPPAQESRGPREHLAPRRLGLAQRDRRHAGPRPLPRAHGVQRLRQLPAGLGRAVLPVAGPGVRTRPERVHQLRPDDVPADAARGRRGRARQGDAVHVGRRHAPEPRPPEIDGERQVILEEKRARSSARQRVQDQVYERLAPESTLGRRLPIGARRRSRRSGATTSWTTTRAGTCRAT